MYVFWSDRSSATSSSQSPHPRTSSGSGVVGSGLSSRPHGGESPGAWWTTAAAATTLLSSRLRSPSARSPSAMVTESTPSEAKSHSLLPQTSGSIEPCHCSPLPVSPAAITRRPQTPQLMAWSFPQTSSWLVTTIVVLRHWGQAAARWTCRAFFSAQQTAVFERGPEDHTRQLWRAPQQIPSTIIDTQKRCQWFFEWAGSLCGKATPWALPGYTWRSDYLIEGIWKPSGLLCLFRTGLPKAEEISL